MRLSWVCLKAAAILATRAICTHQLLSHVFHPLLFKFISSLPTFFIFLRFLPFAHLQGLHPGDQFRTCFYYVTLSGIFRAILRRVLLIPIWNQNLPWGCERRAHSHPGAWALDWAFCAWGLGERLSDLSRARSRLVDLRDTVVGDVSGGSSGEIWSEERCFTGSCGIRCSCPSSSALLWNSLLGRVRRENCLLVLVTPGSVHSWEKAWTLPMVLSVWLHWRLLDDRGVRISAAAKVASTLHRFRLKGVPSRESCRLTLLMLLLLL